jgi:CMP-N-acetylneuraminate monooxygenase
MGGNLNFNGNFVCSQHGWTYKSDGSNINPGSPGLRKINIKFENTEIIEFAIPSKINQDRGVLKDKLTIEVISHASLLLTYGDFKVLFDPWIFGHAYYGSWHLYPSAAVQVSNLKVDAIIITHPHPDHFHLETLSKLDRSIPIYFPDFPSQIIQRGLQQVNWKNVKVSTWGDAIRLSENIYLTFLRPRSNWEDSATFITIEDEGTVFTWLNLVDAGSVIDEYALPKLDLLTSAFDQGASGYPLTWQHIKDEIKIGILKNQKKQNLQLLPARANQLSAVYFLPFAGHWRLGLPNHQIYAEQIPHTSFEEVEKAFELYSPETEVLKVLPGKIYDFLTQEIQESSINTVEYPDLSAVEYPNESNNEIDLKSLSIEFEEFMKILLSKSEAYRVEKVNFIVRSKDNNFHETFCFCSSEFLKSDAIDITVEIPIKILILLASGKANWDHVAIGYWGTWDRTPNIYPANFMRLLQSGHTTPYSNKFFKVSKSNSAILETTISDLIESNPSEMTRILNRAGLPCISCSRQNSETLKNAFEIHGLDLGSNPWVLSEIRSLNT